jgi:subtilase family serine protease
MRKFLVATVMLLVLLAISLNTSSLVYSAPVAHMVRLPLQKVPLDSPLATPQIGNLLTSNVVPGGVPFCKSGGGTIICLSPPFLKSAYDFPAVLDGTGSTIVLIDAFGDPYIQNDLNLFSTTFGLPSTAVTVLCPPTFTGAASDHCPPLSDFTSPTPGSRADLCGAGGWGTESVLDVTMAHGLAPGAKIVLVEAASCFDDDLNAAELAVVSQPSLKGSIMSQSFGEPDDQVDPTIRAQADAIYALARTNGWTVMASSGDWGANTDIIGVGTTELTPS